MTTCLGKSCSFGLPRVPFVNCCQFMYLVISYFPFGFEGWMWDLIVSVPDHCLSFYFLYADEVTLFTRVFQQRSLLWWTPIYFALSTDSKAWLCREYWVETGCLDLLIWSVWHLLGLNAISQVHSQISNLSKSARNMSLSLLCWTIRYM